MNRRHRIPLLALLCLAPFASMAQVAVDQPWVRATPPGAAVAGGYMLLRNPGATADRLVGASSSAAARVELHVHVNDNGVMKMREVKGYDVPAKGSFELKPGGAHLMFMELKRPFKEGEKIPVMLRFEKSGEVSADFVVGKLGASRAPAAGGHKHH